MGKGVVHAVVDPGFSRRRGANFPDGQIFPQNCMKMKEFGPRGKARVPGAPLRSANVMTIYVAFVSSQMILPGVCVNEPIHAVEKKKEHMRQVEV